MQERRRAVRHRTFLQGRVYYNSRRASLDCVIRDISQTGARLQFSSAVTVPDVLELFIPNKDHTWKVRTVWRHDDQLGVCLVETPAQAAAPETVEQRLEAVEAELAILRRQIAALQRGTPGGCGDTGGTLQ